MKNVLAVILLLLAMPAYAAIEGFDDQVFIYREFVDMRDQGRGEFIFYPEYTESPQLSPMAQTYVLSAITTGITQLYTQTEPGLGGNWDSLKRDTDMGLTFEGGGARYALTVADYLDDYFLRQHIFLATFLSADLRDQNNLLDPYDPVRLEADIMGVIVFTFNGFFILTPGTVAPLNTTDLTPIAITTLSVYDSGYRDFIRWKN